MQSSFFTFIKGEKMTEHVKVYGVKPRIQYVADGTLTEYEFPFAIFNTLDIDVYTSGRQQMDLWNEIVRGCNHIAYDTFVAYIRDSYIETMK